MASLQGFSLGVRYQLKALHSHYLERPALTGPVAEYFRTADYTAALNEIGDDPRLLARLTIGLLKHMALNPNRGTRVEDFVQYGGEPPLLESLSENSKTIWFCLDCHHVTNIVGAFSLLRP